VSVVVAAGNSIGENGVAALAGALLALAGVLLGQYLTGRREARRWRQDARLPIYAAFVSAARELHVYLRTTVDPVDDPGDERQRAIGEARDKVILVGPSGVAEAGAALNDHLFAWLRSEDPAADRSTQEDRYRQLRARFVQACQDALRLHD
jgi:hypothetical protein